MKGGDISNRTALSVAFNIECFFGPIRTEERPKGFFKNLFSTNKKRQKRLWESRALIASNVKFLNTFWRNSDYTIDLCAVEVEEVLPMEKIALLPYTNFYTAQDVINLREQLEARNIAYYVDVNNTVISMVGSQRVKAVHFDTFKRMM